MANTTENWSLLSKALEDCIRSEINAVFAEEFTQATKRAETRIRAQLDRIALSLLSEYQIERMGPNILIKVVKGNEN